MAKQSAVPKDDADRGRGARKPAHALTPVRGRSPDEPGSALALDRLIHERMRLGIVSALAVNERLSFNDLKALLETTDGNLSVHARKLEEAGYVTCTKTFEGRDAAGRSTRSRPPAGARSSGISDHMEALIRATREG